MNEFEEGMFKYITDPKNYTSANELSSLLVGVNEKLILDFWEEVHIKLKEDLNEHELNILLEVRKFTFTKSNWYDVAIGFEDLDLGLIVKKNKFYEDDVLKIVEKYKEKLPSIHHENENWLCYDPIENYKSYRFSNFNELFQILPDNRDRLIHQIVDILKTFAVSKVTICDEINELKRK